ncbi:NAD(P)H-dependent oxidoreductase subunit E [Candidatus Magnetominusculus xianensis]|uniref:NADH dehydrogenase n=1 Tax=Candidatus Magnetominusculus xianensis TaxID=1748249 RepID=A0ABR5SIY3_9BACT|nr:NAD(P)H-dependent oxidoreductase subunit E [Candidatus Magnetominusculus xianensis]KWT92943.1 NADH dehydrogenase [Candidatus Magnetominusculus xianensis]MBF0402947.1 NAD(P)H-dependent oxidoreductase subunit E [Nitrospirota bacterium]
MEGNILIVDDDDIVVKSCDSVLAPEGFTITGTTDSSKAIELIRDNDYDIVITDLNMPGIDGFELIRQINALKPSTGIVVITGFTSQQNIKDILQLGIIDYISKPFSPHTLLETILKATYLIKKIKALSTAEPDTEPDAKKKTEALNNIIDEYKSVPGSLLRVLESAQDLIGYLPPSVQRFIANGLRIPVSEVYSVVSFYPYFTMKARGKHHIRVCVGNACHAKKSGQILTRLKRNLNFNEDNITADGKFSFETVRCLGACGFAPIVEIDYDTHGAVDPDKTLDILKDYH